MLPIILEEQPKKQKFFLSAGSHEKRLKARDQRVTSGPIFSFEPLSYPGSDKIPETGPAANQKQETYHQLFLIRPSHCPAV